MKFRIRFADQIVGVFVLLALAMLGVIMIAVGSRQRWFSRDYTYRSTFSSGSGISVGTPVLLKGFQIGRIHQVSLNDKNEADIIFKIYDTYVEKVHKNSILEYVTSPIGVGSQLLFHQGTSEEYAEENSFIPSYDTELGRRLVADGLVDRPPKDDTITRLLSNVNPLVENVNATVIQLERVLSQANDAIAGTGTGPVADAIDQASEAVSGVNTLVGQVNGIVGKSAPRLDAILAQVEEIANSAKAAAESVVVMGANFEKTSEAFKDPTGIIPKLIDPKGSLKTLLDDGDRIFNKIDNSLASVEGTLDNLEGATATLSTQMPRIAATIEEARLAIVQAQDVLIGLKNNPLLRGGIPERVDPRSAPTSLRTTDF
ncbi:hypothetical protein MASR2M78_13930 [Treponema sp.]